MEEYIIQLEERCEVTPLNYFGLQKPLSGSSDRGYIGDMHW